LKLKQGDWEVVKWFSKIPYELAMNCKDYLKTSKKNEHDVSRTLIQ